MVWNHAALSRGQVSTRLTPIIPWIPNRVFVTGLLDLAGCGVAFTSEGVGATRERLEFARLIGFRRGRRLFRVLLGSLFLLFRALESESLIERAIR